MKHSIKAKGFTLTELIVVITVILILAGATALSISAFVNYSVFKKQNEYAQQLYNAAQLQLNAYGQLGQLEALEALEADELNLNLLKTDDGSVTSETLWGEKDVMYQGTVRYVIATSDDYSSYIAGELDGSNRNQALLIALYDMFDAYVYNKSILYASICVEFDSYDGLVYSVLYNDRGDTFSYDGTGGTLDISDRTYSYRRERFIGYYGVDTLSKATSTEAEKPVISNVLLNNENTLNLSFSLSKVKQALGLISYEAVIYDAGNKTPLMSIIFNDITLRTSNLDTANYALVSKDSKKYTCTIEAKVTIYGSGGSVGIYTFPAWIESDGKVRLVLDAADLGATAKLYKSGVSALSDTFSLHRFGLDAENIYVTLQGMGSGYKATAKKQSNTEHMYFGGYSSGSEGTIYTLFNGRHLYNLRYKEADAGSTSVTYRLTRDINWSDMTSGSSLYKDKTSLITSEGYSWNAEGKVNRDKFTDSELYVSSSDPETVRAFISVDKLSAGHTLCSVSKNTYTVSGLIILNEANTAAGVDVPKANGLNITKATGLFLMNYGRIESICLDKVKVVGGDCTGAVCGVNLGALDSVSILNSDGTSVVSGIENVGGIVGYQRYSNQYNSSASNLLNRASISGNSKVGGVTGSAETVQGNQTAVLSGCTNYGIITPTGDNPQMLGGIAGYAAIQGSSTLTLSGCVSSPQYDLSEIENDLKGDKTLLTGKYVGGIVGCCDGAVITGCSTRSEQGIPGFVFGDDNVGGIVGYSKASSAVLSGSVAGQDDSVNEAHIIGNTNVGGIVGSNSEKSTVENWLNKGVVLARDKYSGGITGSNNGEIIDCGCDVDYSALVRKLISWTDFSADCCGGITGYNNGKIKASTDLTLSAVCVVSGGNYIGGIVGLNGSGGECSVKNYELQGGYIYGRVFVGGFIGLNLSSSLFPDNNYLCANPNAVSGDFCVGGILGGNLICPSADLTVNFNADNILGTVEAKQFAGAFIGLNVLTSKESSLKGLYESILDLGDDYSANIDQINALTSACGSSLRTLTIDGGNIRLLGISARVCVGGAVGYNGSGTYLYIKDVANHTPVTANSVVSSNGVNYAYAGGIIGRVSRTVVVDGCENSGSGEVISGGTYTGCICEVNEGLILDCSVENAGGSGTSNIGAIAGLNLASEQLTFGSAGFVKSNLFDTHAYVGDDKLQSGIVSSGFSGTITGSDGVGGIVSMNRGLILDPIVSGSVMCYGQYGGGVAAVNEGKITIYLTVSVTLGGSGESVGGIAGSNSGEIISFPGSDAEKTLIKSGSGISGKRNVGGVIGIQTSGGELSGLVSCASVTATDGDCGGIIGALDTDEELTLSACVCSGGVSATLSGNAAGIIPNVTENTTLTECQCAGNVSSYKGLSGGISVYNCGNIENCVVSPLPREEQTGQTFWQKLSSILSALWAKLVKLFSEKEYDITVSSEGDAGIICAYNYGSITGCRAGNVLLTNFQSSASDSLLGGIAGYNYAGGKISLPDSALDGVSVVARVNGCCAGGVCGINEGDVTGAGENSITCGDGVSVGIDSSVTRGTLGGAAGKSSGTIKDCLLTAYITGAQGDSASPSNGYGGICGVNSGDITDCSFSGEVFSDGNSSFIACIGGIAGISAGNIKECTVGTDSDTITVIQNGSGTTAYGYVGGLCGLNEGLILNCDSSGSTGSVSILNYAGHTGGIVGKNTQTAQITGTDAESITSTGNWTILVQYYDNDCGIGGIAGYSASGLNMTYVDNRAEIYYTQNSNNVSTGGFIGRNENNTTPGFTLSYCYNYGNIYAKSGYTGGFFGTVKFFALSVSDCANYGQVGSSSAVTGYYYNCGSSTRKSVTVSGFSTSGSSGVLARTYAIINASDSTGIMRFDRVENHGMIVGRTFSAGIMSYSDGTSSPSIRLYFTDCVNTGVIISSGTGAGIACGISSAASLNILRCKNFGLCGESRVNYFAGIYYSGKQPTLLSDCYDCSNATTYPISNCSSSTEMTGNYFVTQGMTVTEETLLAPVSISASDITKDGTYGSSVQSGYPLSNICDKSNSIATGSARLTASGTDWKSDYSNTVEIILPLADSSGPDAFSIFWGNNGNEGVYRRYTYKIYYMPEGESEWTELIAVGSTGDNYINYDYSINAYRAVGYPASKGNDSLYYHDFSSVSEKVSKIKISVGYVETSSNNSTWSKNQYIIIGEAQALAYQTVTSVTGGDDVSGIAIGSPLAPGGESGNYTLTANDMKITGLKVNPAQTENGKCAYRIDTSAYQTYEQAYASSGSFRYRLYYDLNPLISSSLLTKYAKYTGKITVGTPTDSGGGTYTISWTSTQTAYAYEASYKAVGTDGVVYAAFGNAVAETSGKTADFDIPQSLSGCSLTFAVRAVYYTESDGTYAKAYSDWYTSSSVTVKAYLPAPIIHLELCSVNGVYKYKAVLDNTEAYANYNPQNIKLTLNGVGSTVSFTASEGESAATISISDTRNYILIYQMTDNSGTYASSVKRNVQTMLFSPSKLNTTDYASTTFGGFYGTRCDSMYYSVEIGKTTEDVETYYAVELLIYDKDVGAMTAISFSESHVTTYGQQLTALLSGFPDDFMSDWLQYGQAVTVRTYPWRTQAYMSYFGHTIAAGLTAEQVKELNIEEGDGRVIRKNADGTYDVNYSEILAGGSVFEKQVDLVSYTVSLRSDGYYYITGNNYSKRVRTSPVINSNYVYTPSSDSYAFSWTSSEAGAEYYVTLYGTLDENTTEIGSITTTDTSAIFKDENWNYTKLTLRVECCGTSDKTGATEVFPNLSREDYALKLRLMQISAPGVSFHSEDGVVQKDDLIYDITWAGISSTDLGCYEITVLHTAADGTITKAVFYTGQTSGTLYSNDVVIGSPACSSASATATAVTVNLNGFDSFGGDEAEISVRAMAKASAQTYGNGADGVVRKITIPTRLAVPDLNNMSYTAPSFCTPEKFSSDGVTLTMQQAYTDKGSYELYIEIVDKNGEHVAYINSGSTEVTRDNPLTMYGGLQSATLNLTGISADYAGMYLKLCARATSDSNISSYWTDEAANGGTRYVYFRLPLVRVNTPRLTDVTEQIVYDHGSTQPGDWDTAAQSGVSFRTVDYAGEYELAVILKDEDAFIKTDENHRKSRVMLLRLVSQGSTYRLYVRMTDTDGYEAYVDLGLLNGDNTPLPYTYTVGDGSEALELCSFIRYEDGTFTLILPDCVDESAYPTQSVSAKALADDTDNYVDSYIGVCSCGTTPGVFSVLSEVEEEPGQPELTSDDFSIEKSASGDYIIYFNAPYRAIAELTSGADGEPGFTRFVSVPGNEIATGSYDCALSVSKEDAASLGTSFTIRIRYVTPDGLSLSASIELTP